MPASPGRCRSGRRESQAADALLALLYLLASAVVMAAPARLAADPLQCGGSACESVRSLQADTIRGDERGALWTEEKLKELLREQSGGETGGSGKNARIAMLCSILFPGLGQMYNERPVKAIVAAGVETFYLSRILLNHRYFRRAERLRDSLPPGSSQWQRQDWWVDEYKERRLDWIWWSGAVMVVLIIDSYIDSHLYDMNVSVEGIAVEKGGGIGLVFAF